MGSEFITSRAIDLHPWIDFLVSLFTFDFGKESIAKLCFRSTLGLFFQQILLQSLSA